VEPYDTASAAGPFAASTSLFSHLIDDLHDPASQYLTHDELEDLLDDRGRALLRQLLQDHLDLRAQAEESAARTAPSRPLGPDLIPRPRLEVGHPRLLATVFGKVTVSRCAWRAPGRPNCHPADAALGLPRGRHSFTLGKLAALEAVRGSFDAAAEAIGRRCGKVIAKHALEQQVLVAAGDIDAFYRARVAVPAAAATLLVISVDGKGIVMRPEALRAGTARAAKRGRAMRTRLAGGERSNRKRMATLAAVYDAEPAVRRPHDVIAPPGGRSGDRTLRPGPKAQLTWLTGSVKRDAAEVIADAFRVVEDRDPGHRRTWVVLVDGAPHQIELITAEAARRHAPIHIVIDLVHVLEYLWTAAWCFHQAADPAAEDWVAGKALAVLAGRAEAVAAQITEAANAAGLAEADRRGADKCVQYLTGKQEYLHYEEALAHGWPVATGVIEGACRHLIADRLDITGARWGLEGAEAVLTLRAVMANGDFDRYWRFHTARERDRLYPRPEQRGFALGA